MQQSGLFVLRLQREMRGVPAVGAQGDRDIAARFSAGRAGEGHADIPSPRLHQTDASIKCADRQHVLAVPAPATVSVCRPEQHSTRSKVTPRHMGQISEKRTGAAPAFVTAR